MPHTFRGEAVAGRFKLVLADPKKECKLKCLYIIRRNRPIVSIFQKNNGNSWPVFVQKPDVFVQKTKTFVQKQIGTCGYSLCFLLVCQRISGIDSEETAETDDVMPFYL